MTRRKRCAQCGVEYDDGFDCESCFHALLAFENENPPAFAAVHHLTVIAYSVQHPEGYSREALDAWREFLDVSLSGGATPTQLLDRARRKFGGSQRVRDQKAKVPSIWPKQWPVSVQEVFRPEEHIGVDAYVERARAWARAVNDTLRATLGVQGKP